MCALEFPTRNLQVGGVSKDQLLERLAATGVALNEAARILFESELFTTLTEPTLISCVELSVAEMGFSRGATFPEIQNKTESMKLALAPVELGPHLRLHHSMQDEGYTDSAATEHKAPPGSITIASAPITQDESFPKGFYLRSIAGALWLRGYWSGPDHVWSPEDRLIFQSQNTKQTTEAD